MKSRSQFFKLQELRAKTDRELVIIIDRELDLAFYFASLAGLPHTRTQIDFTEATRLIAAVENPSERVRLQMKKRQLCEDLDRLSVPQPLQARTTHS